MSELVKIKDVSMKYAVTARTLRYYEDIGLLASTRAEGYAHRMYDEKSIIRLKQILVLRKLNISVKDIKRIFMASDPETVLEVLVKKKEDIDDEIALLHELKIIVLDFIDQIKKSDFHNDAEVRLLYDKAGEIETRLGASEFNGNPAGVNRLIEVSEKLDEKRLTLPAAIKAYRQNGRAMRFIGNRYTNDDRVDGMFGAKWDEWFENGRFELLKSKLGVDFKDFYIYDDGDAPIGLMCHRDGDHKNFEYWIGYFTPEDTAVPDGFDYEDFPKKDIGVCWLYGRENEVYGIEPLAFEKLLQEGYEVVDDRWFERCSPIRSAPDKNGNIILDICFFIK